MQGLLRFFSPQTTIFEIAYFIKGSLWGYCGFQLNGEISRNTDRQTQTRLFGQIRESQCSVRFQSES